MKKVFLFLLIAILSMSIAIAQQQKITPLDHIDNTNVKEDYANNPPQIRNKQLEITNSPLTRSEANSFLIKDLIKEKYQQSIADGSIKLITEKILVRGYGASGEILGIKSYEELKFNAKLLGDTRTSVPRRFTY